VTLDPDARRWLDRAAELGLPPLWQLSAEEVRRQSRAGLAAGGAAEEVHHLRDDSISGVGVRLYRPRPELDLPVLVYCHGGGWVTGDLETMHAPLTILANRSGWEIVSVDYRLAPEHPFPAGLDDCVAVARSLIAQGRRVAVGGDSAGANLAAGAALTLAPDLLAQVLIYPVLDRNLKTSSYREFESGYGLTRRDMERYWSDYAGPEPPDPLATPLRTPELGHLPPSLVFSAECDVLREDGDVYARRLEQAGVDVTWKCWTGMIHGFIRLESMSCRSEALQAVADFLISRT